eukprot:TRINITY_DN2347_c0_g1_i1.p1 TRINITY_DN2347_c0_g1~~TRINITY_DN2347_c0_g1_i1.p1  ORF type:complete len:340 (-),score=111.87 TRINITY_DN2347_c0_g1_i1:189-1208(-)
MRSAAVLLTAMRLCECCAQALLISMDCKDSVVTVDVQKYLDRRRAKVQRFADREATLAAAKIIRKDKHKAKRQRQREELGNEEFVQRRALKRLARQQGEERLREALAIPCGPRIVVDLAYSDQHCPEALQSLARQVARAYGALRASDAPPPALWLTSCGTATVRAAFAQQGWDAWAVERREESVFDCVPRESIVYLSPDAEHALDGVEAGVTYVVGGIVDRSVRRGMSLARAAAHGVACARLPLHWVEEYARASGGTKRVLNVDTVVCILAAALRDRPSSSNGSLSGSNSDSDSAGVDGACSGSSSSGSGGSSGSGSENGSLAAAMRAVLPSSRGFAGC